MNSHCYLQKFENNLPQPVLSVQNFPTKKAVKLQHCFLCKFSIVKNLKGSMHAQDYIYVTVYRITWLYSDFHQLMMLVENAEHAPEMESVWRAQQQINSCLTDISLSSIGLNFVLHYLLDASTSLVCQFSSKWSRSNSHSVIFSKISLNII